MPLLTLLAIGWLAGLWAAEQLNQPWWAWLLAAGLAAGSLVFLRPERGLRLGLAVVIALGLGAARFEAARPPLGDPAFLATYNGSGHVVLTGVVWDEPDVFEAHTRLRVRVDSILLADGARPLAVEGLALVNAPRLLASRQGRAGQGAFAYGDRLRIAGSLGAPPVFDGFSYRDYLARQGVHSEVRDANIIFVAEQAGPPVWQALFNFKARALATLAHIFPEPHAALLAGILLGVESGIPQDVKEDFNATSTSHIVAISGFNIAILAGLITAVTRRVWGPRRGLLLALAVIAAYTLLVGAQGSVVRAAIMGSLALAAARLGRRSHGLNALALAAVLMTLMNPGWLRDVGFQLSAAATLGLVLYSEPFTAGMRRLAERVTSPTRAQQVASLAGELFLVTLAAHITTLPLTLMYFHRLSLVALLANLVILPVQPAVMLVGGAALLLGLIWLPLGQLAAWAAWPFTAYTLGFVKMLAGVPAASFAMGEVAAPAVVLFFACLFGLTWLFSKPADERPAWVAKAMERRAHGASFGLLIVGAALAWGWYFSLPEPDGRLRITLLDIHNPAATLEGGEALLIQVPGGARALVNGGPGGLTLARALDERLPLVSRELDLLVAAGGDSEHIGALPELVDRYRVRRAVLTSPPSRAADYRELVRKLMEQNVERIDAASLPTFDLGDGISLRVIADYPDGGLLRLERGGFSVLIPIGLDAQAEASLLERGLVQPATALLLTDGGAANANSPAWVSAVDPHIVLVSAAPGADRPSPEVLARLAGRSVLRTDEHGSITLETDGEQMWVTLER